MFEWFRRRSRQSTILDQESLFEGFTENSHLVVALAQEEARHLKHSYVGTEHVLLGLRREDAGVAATVLRSLGVELDDIRERVGSIVGYGEEPVVGQVPLAPHSKKVLEMARLEARQLGHAYIGTEHLLLGLASKPEGVAAEALSNLGVDPNEIRQEVFRQLGVGE